MSLTLYKEISVGNNQFLREFDGNSNRNEIEEWHRDREDRIVEVIENHDWLIQLDNELPKILKETINISKETYHRVIMGKSKLVVKITKLS